MKDAPNILINGYLYEMVLDDVFRICVLEHERNGIIEEAHYGPIKGHFHADMISQEDISSRIVADDITYGL